MQNLLGKMGGRKMKELTNYMQLLMDKAEELNWSYDRENEPGGNYGGWKRAERDYIELSQYSPGGEDFSALIDFKGDNQVLSFMENLKSYAENFDIDGHVEMWIPVRGKGGCPESISDLVTDAEAIKDMLMTLYTELEKLMDDTYDLFVSETEDEDGEVDNNYFEQWLKEKMQ